MLRVRAVSNEDKRIVLEEREMKVIIAQPIWLSLWALLFYTILIGLILSLIHIFSLFYYSLRHLPPVSVHQKATTFQSMRSYRHPDVQ